MYKCMVQISGGERAGGIGTHHQLHRADFIVPSFSRWELSLSMESESRMFFSPVVMLYFQSEQQTQNVNFSSVLQMNLLKCCCELPLGRNGHTYRRTDVRMYKCMVQVGKWAGDTLHFPD
ncbi:hypothetical protein Vretimale_16357 [Volvox reticuliferus]|uniref:Uncharacterized protein n=1 Tax=Volvox reticuliferus TaxID=1737510 RepID=A0A8J4GQZ6_9CHLO|nr:hypothetical protein Vretimale_16357 [Volvox reticuliferus]